MIISLTPWGCQGWSAGTGKTATKFGSHLSAKSSLRSFNNLWFVDGRHPRLFNSLSSLRMEIRLNVQIFGRLRKNILTRPWDSAFLFETLNFTPKNHAVIWQRNLLLERHQILGTSSCRCAILGSHSYLLTSKVAWVAPQTRESNRLLSEELILWERKALCRGFAFRH